MVLLPVRLSFGFLVSLCLVSGSGGRPVEPFKLELFKFPLKLSNITFHNCGPPDPTAFLWCRQLAPPTPLRLRCTYRFTPRVTVYSAYTTSLWTLDGMYVYSDEGDNSRCQEWSTNSCPWFANVTYGGETFLEFSGRTLVAPNGHYAHKFVAVNQDKNEFLCFVVQGNIIS